MMFCDVCWSRDIRVTHGFFSVDGGLRVAVR